MKLFCLSSVLALVALLPSNAHCARPRALAPRVVASTSASARPSVLVGLGLLANEVGRRSGSSSGATSLLGSPYLNFSLIGEFQVEPSWYFSPVLAYTFFGSKGADTDEKTSFMTFALRAEKRLSDFELHAGPGVLIEKVSGEGGTTTLKNGTSTAVFGLPSGSQSSLMTLIDLGIGSDVNVIHYTLDVYLVGLASTRRALTLALTLSYGVF